MERQPDLLDRLVKLKIKNPRDRLIRNVERRILCKKGSRAWYRERIRRLVREADRAGWLADKAAAHMRLVVDELRTSIEEAEKIGRKRSK